MSSYATACTMDLLFHCNLNLAIEMCLLFIIKSNLMSSIIFPLINTKFILFPFIGYKEYIRFATNTLYIGTCLPIVVFCDKALPRRE